VHGAQAKQVIGWVEKAALVEVNLLVHAKIDTGADHSSLNAADYQLIDKKDGQWVRFRVTNREGLSVIIEKQLLRYANIKRKNQPPEKRPVVELAICIGNVYKIVAVSLVDRSNYDYQMLIGRSFLSENSLVDSAMQYTTKPECELPVIQKGHKQQNER
jgi:hypothetical protein